MRNIHATLVVVLALAGCAGQLPSDEPRGPADPQGSQGSQSDVAPAAFQADDDLFAGDMPDMMVDAHTLELDGEELDADLQKALYGYALEHTDDARPWLLLARDSMRRSWDGFAVRQYGSAIDADARAASQDGVLADLVWIAGHSQGAFEQRESTALIADVYGPDALPAIDRALADAQRMEDLVAAERLRALRAGIEQ